MFMQDPDLISPVKEEEEDTTIIFAENLVKFTKLLSRFLRKKEH